MSELADALVRQVNALEARAEKAERERDEERAKKETFACAAEHYCKERDEAKEKKARLRDYINGYRAPVCKSCEGALTCVKCAPVFTQEFLRGLSEDAGDEDPPGWFDDHEARIKALADRVKELEDFCGQKCQQCGGYILRHVEGCPTLAGKMPLPGNAYLGCKRCGGPKKSFQVYCGAACASKAGA